MLNMGFISKINKKYNIIKIKMVCVPCFSLMLKIRSYSPILSFFISGQIGRLDTLVQKALSY